VTLRTEPLRLVTFVPDGIGTSEASVVSDTVDINLLVGLGENTSTATRAPGI